MSNFTQKAIIETFSDMLREQPYSKITVKDLVERCGINRNTFYYHFPDLPTLVEEIMKLECDNIIRNSVDIRSPQDFTMIAIDFAKKNRAAAMHIYNSVNRESFEIYLDRICQYTISRYIDYLSDGMNIDTKDKEVIVLFYKCSCTGLILDWLKSGMDENVDDIAKRLLYLFEGSTMMAIEKAAGISR